MGDEERTRPSHAIAASRRAPIHLSIGALSLLLRPLRMCSDSLLLTLHQHLHRLISSMTPTPSHNAP
jgi:hypothetical protein